jgi:hypothetical protein
MGALAPQVKERLSSALDAVLTAALLAALALQAHLATRLNVNWDEFYYLAQIHEFRRGELALAVNTFHVHLFSWLTLMPANEIGQVVAARFVMLALETVTVACLVAVAQVFMSRTAALVAALTYVSFVYVVAYGASFRTDPIATALLMTALWLLATSRIGARKAVALGVAVALAGLVTIKSVFYVPTLALVALWRWRSAGDRPATIRAFLIAAGVGAVTFAGLFLWHRATLAPQALVSAADVAGGAFDKTVASAGLFPRPGEIGNSMAKSPVTWLLVLTGAAFCALSLAKTAPVGGWAGASAPAADPGVLPQRVRLLLRVHPAAGLCACRPGDRAGALAKGGRVAGRTDPTGRYGDELSGLCGPRPGRAARRRRRRPRDVPAPRPVP